ncbi:MAG TPA: hypothetical protein VK500_02425 [Nitrospiraceae bacterium]|nr:hypothetical protein [Nitrospiraceae bacterium]
MILYSEGDTKTEEADGHHVLEILVAAYPGHPWAARVSGGVVFIKHLEFGTNWGMVKKFADIKHDAAVFKKEIIMAAGEFLERAGLVRGRANGDEIVHVEGVPEKDQPKVRYGKLLH